MKDEMTQLPEGVTLPKWHVLRGTDEITEWADKVYFEREWRQIMLPNEKVGDLPTARPMTPEEIEAATVEKCCKQDPAPPDKMALASQLCKWCTDGDVPERRWHDGPRWGHWQLNPEYPQCHAEQIHEAFYSLEQEGESK